jgi:hypothetical protein
MPDYFIPTRPTSPPDISRLLLTGLSSIPDSYYEGQKQQYEQRLRQPVSTDPDELLKQAAERGGLQLMQHLLPYQLLARSGGQTATALSNLERDVSGASTDTSPNHPTAAGPANIVPPQARVQYPQEGTEGTSLTLMGTELAGGRDVQPIIIAWQRLWVFTLTPSCQRQPWPQRRRSSVARSDR